MQVLNINFGKSFFIVGGVEVAPEDLSRDNLLKILNDIYETTEEVILPEQGTLDEIRNPVEKEIVQQVIQKISDFSDNVQNIQQEVQTQFPDIEYLD